VPQVNAAVLTELFILLRLGILDEAGISDWSLNFKRELCFNISHSMCLSVHIKHNVSVKNTTVLLHKMLF